MPFSELFSWSQDVGRSLILTEVCINCCSRERLQGDGQALVGAKKRQFGFVFLMSKYPHRDEDERANHSCWLGAYWLQVLFCVHGPVHVIITLHKTNKTHTC